MGSLRLNSSIQDRALSTTLVCRVRKTVVQSTPEELVRQALLEKMVHQWGYPASLIAVEKAISELPLEARFFTIPRRRIDIVCYAQMPKRPGLIPLLLVECKQGAVSKGTLRQLLGYNYYIGAPFIALAAGLGNFSLFPAFGCKKTPLFMNGEAPTYEKLIHLNNSKMY